MTNLSDLRRDMNRGLHAKTIIEDAIVVEALNAMEKRCHDPWATSPAADSAVREEAYH